MPRRLLTASVVASLLAAPLSLMVSPVAAHAATDSPVFEEVAYVVGESIKTASLSDPASVGTKATYGSSDIVSLTASANGSRFAYVVLTPSPGPSSVRSMAIVSDVAGREVRTLDVRGLRLPATEDGEPSGTVVSSPVLAPDGNAAVWSVTNFDLGTTALRRAVLPTGGVQDVAGGATLTPVGFVDATTLLGIDEQGLLVTLPLAGGTTRPVAGGAPVVTAAVSPKADRVALVTGDDAEILSSAPLSKGTDGSWVLGTPVVLTSELATADSPQFSHDGAQVFWAQDRSVEVGTTRTDSDLFAVPTDGGTPAPLRSTPDVDEASPVGIAVDTAKPGPPTLLPMLFSGTSVTVRWTPADDGVASEAVHLERTGGGSLSSQFVNGTSFTDINVSPGVTYTYSLRSVSRSGPYSDPVTRQVTTVDPTARFSDPTSSASTNRLFRVTFAPGATYSAQYRVNGTGDLQPWLDHATGSSQVFDRALAGSSYGLLVTTYDAFGNSSRPTGAGVAVVPYDQTRAAFSGSVVTESRADRYLGTATLLRTAGSAARMTFTGNRVQVIGERCAGCGVLDVYVDGVRVAGIDTHDASRRPRTVLYTRLVKPGSHTLVVKARGTSGHPNVVLDGFAVRH